MKALLGSIIGNLHAHLNTKKEQWIVEAHLQSKLYMHPTLDNQQLWARNLAPHLEFNLNLDCWNTLLRFTLPLIHRYGSSAHLRGIDRLKLNQDAQPSWDEFKLSVERETSWSLEICDKELDEPEYFALLAQRKFPCVYNLRPLNAVFCGYAPDFWHEAIGHIAVLTDPGYADFYQWCGDVVSKLYSAGELEKAKCVTEVLWVLLEYGFILENGFPKTFGAALTGSFMALNRFERGHIALKDFDVQAVHNSKLYDRSRPPLKNNKGQIEFFIAKDLNHVREEIEKTT